MRRILIATFLTSLFLPKAEACSVCYCGDPTLLPLGLLQPESGQLRLSLDTSFLQKESGGAESISLRHGGNPGQVEQHQELRLMMTGTLTLRDTTLSLAAPWLTKSLTEKRGAAVETSSLAGPGDIEVYVRQQWFLTHRIAPVRHIVAVALGAKLPTGGSGDVELSPGSGSLDSLLGLSYTYDADPISLYGSVLGRYNGEGSSQLQYGSSLLVNFAARYRINDYILVAAQLNGRVTSKDTEGASQDPDSGGAILFVSPQVVVRPKGTWALRGMIQIPTIERLNGSQSESLVYQLGVSYDL